MSMKTWSWGNIPVAEHRLLPLTWSDSAPDFSRAEGPFLAYGYGRSYGDVPVNDGGALLQTSSLNRVLSFDRDSGVLHCEAGTSLQDILSFCVPAGWFLPVTPGTQFVSLGGAVANDVHGKNHHCAGTFGCHVLGFDLVRSNGETMWCSLTENKPLFAATIGGLGLTGLILTVKLQLKKIVSNLVDVENIPFANLAQGLDLFKQYNASTYSVAWIDCIAGGSALGRGIFSYGEHSERRSITTPANRQVSVPFNFPSFALNKYSVRAFNEVYYKKGCMGTPGIQQSYYEPFFYPLDKLLKWNRIYGKKGFYQYQCVVPFGDNDEGAAAIEKMLTLISHSGNASFLAVLKVFGDKQSPGILSFPMKGITLALDFSNRGARTLALFSELDKIVINNGGRVYPAKDARMSADAFSRFFPQWQEFEQYIDDQFSSSFWRRVTEGLK